MHTGTNTYDVFLSHNSRDKSLIEPLAEELKAKGIKVWLDAWALVPGETWQDGLANGLEQSEAIVVAFGEQGVGNW